MKRPGQGAAACGGGGEPEQVRNRSRPQNRCPEASNTRVAHGGSDAYVLSPHQGPHDRPFSHRVSQALERFGGTRGWHGSDGRTVIGRGLGRRRNIDHAN